MERTVEISGTLLMLLLYGITLVGLVAILWTATDPLQSAPDALLALLFVLFAVLTVVGLWRRLTGNFEGVHRDGAYDIAYDPIAYPGQAAKHNWQKAIRGLRTDGGDGDGDSDDGDD